jgi:glutamate dehydrogenase
MTPETFANEVFRRVAADDLALLSDASREHLAAAAYDRYIAPRLGTRIELIDSPGDEFTVLEIVNDDMPFLLDSTLAELTDRGIEPRLVAHPVFQTERDSAGRVVALGVKGDEIGQPESFIHIHLPRVISTETRESLIDSLRKIFNDVRTAVADWRPMRAEVEEAVRTFKLHPPPLAVDEVAEAVQFLEWMLADNYIFMGMRAFRLPDGEVAADPLEGSGLGILRDPGVKVLRRGKELVAITPEVRAFLREPVALIITKASVKSRIHRRAHMDYVGVKLFDTDGHLIGELSIVGLFTSTAYYHTTREIPYLRHKVARVVARAGFAADSHSGNALTNVLESYPRDELFQLDVETLFSISMEILSLTERPRLKAIPRLDRFDRFVSVLVFIPKDRYDTSVRRRVGAYLADVYKGRLSAAYPAYPEGPLARTHFIIGRDDGETPAVPRSEIEAAIAAIVRTWSDDLETALAKGTSADVAHARQARYRAAFGAAYREAFTVEDALEDIAIMDRLNTERPRAVDFYRKRGDDLTRANLKVFALNVPMPLSERVPLLEGLGFTVVNERTYRVVRGEGEDGRVWLHDMTLERASGGSIDVAEIEPKIEAVLIALFNGQTESDGYNGLILEAGLGWREVAMLRTLSRYAQQIRAPFSQDYMWSTLKRHPTIAAQLVALFMARFDPRLNTPQAVRAAHEAEVAAGIEADLQGVSSLDEDRILRRFRNLIQAAVRTNFFQLGADGRPRDTIAFKFEAA